MHFSILLLITIFISLNAQLMPIPNTKSLFTIKRIMMSTSPINLNFTFPQEYSNPTYTYSIEKAFFQDKQFSVRKKSSQLTNTQIQIEYQFFDNINLLNFQISIATIVSNMELVWMSIEQISAPTLFQSYSIALGKSYQNTLQYTYKISMFTHTIPINYTYYMQNSSSIYLTVTQIEIGTNLLSLGIIIIQRNIKMKYALVLYQKYWNKSSSYKQQTGQWFKTVNSDSAFPGFRAISFKDVSVIQKTFNFNLSFQFIFNYVQNQISYVYITFKGRPQNTKLQSQYSVLLFNNTFACPYHSYLPYLQPFFAIAPSSNFCSLCDSTCGDCTSLPTQSEQTDQFHCLSCTGFRYYENINTNQTRCSCLPSLETDPITNQCKTCTFKCLTFYVKLISVIQNSQFILVFNIPNIVFIMNVEENLKVQINDNYINYTIEEMRNGFYSISVNPDDIKSCQSKCIALFTFDHPELVTANSITLSTKSQSLQIQDFYVLGQTLSNDINQAFFVVSVFMFVSSSAGQISFVKILFDLEQTIEFHKYLQFQIPLIFKEFVQALSVFKFLDLTNAIPIDVTSFFLNITPNELDNVGTFKSVYYQFGSNFFKNIVSVVLSLLAIWLINLVAFIILRIIPFQISRNFAQKIWLRKYITLHDTFQTAMIPIIVFGSWQTLNMPSMKYWWIYLMSYSFNLLTLLIPFLAVLHIYSNRKDHETEQINEDLLQDCKINLKTSYIFYLYTMYKKIIFSFLIGLPLPGLLQILFIIFINIVYLISIIHIARYNIYTSKFKLVIRAINSLSLIGIEVLILVINLFPIDVTTQAKIGLACTYMAIAATIAGVLQMLAKIAETIFQKVKDQAKEGFFFKRKDVNEPDPDFVNKVVKCNLDQLGQLRLHAQPSNFEDGQNQIFRKSNLTFGSDLVFLQDDQQNLNNDLSNTRLDHDSQLVFIQDDEQIDPIETIEDNKKKSQIFKRKPISRKKRTIRGDPQMRISNNIIVRPTSIRRVQENEQLSVVQSQTSRIDLEKYEEKKYKKH